MRARRSVNLLRWKCSIPGREGTDWQGGFFPLTMEFSEDYPAKPPKVPARCLGLLPVSSHVDPHLMTLLPQAHTSLFRNRPAAHWLRAAGS